MWLSLETLMSIIRTGQRILVELRDLVNSVIIFLSQTTLLRWLTFLLGFQTVIFTVMLFWIYFFLQTPAFDLQLLSLHCEILIMLLSQFLLTFHQIHKRMPHFIAWLMTILVLIGTTLVIIWQMLHWRGCLYTAQYFCNSQDGEKVIANLDLSKVSGDCWKVLSGFTKYLRMLGKV